MKLDIILVNEQDVETGVSDKQTVHKQGLCHRAFSVFVLRKQNDEIEILLQQRHPSKYHCGGLWTNSCCSHPQPNEEVIAAGKRRLREELGFSVELKEVGVFHYVTRFDNGLTENEVDHVLVGSYDDQLIVPNPEEVADYRWITVSELQKELAQHPEKYTPWLPLALRYFLG